MPPISAQTLPRTTAMSGAVMSLTLCVFVLIASEFMPVSLLTPIASGLSITEGVAGQVISVSGLFAVIASLSISVWTRNIDRKHVVAGLTLVLALSGVVVTWGNLALFYAGYRYSSGLIRPGRIEAGVEPLQTRGEFPLRVERIS